MGPDMGEPPYSLEKEPFSRELVDDASALYLFFHGALVYDEDSTQVSEDPAVMR
jgi:hypothetical protein